MKISHTIGSISVVLSFSALCYTSVGLVTADTLSQKGNAHIPDRYIVVFKDTVVDVDKEVSKIEYEYGVSSDMKYKHAIRGFAGVIPEGKMKALAKDSRVHFISEDREVHLFGKPDVSNPQPSQITPTGVRRIGASASSTGSTGAGVGVAVIDTGIDMKHPDLVANISSFSKSCVTGARTATDDNGHGTHVAGTIAGVNNSAGVVGVAPEATLFAVKVLNKNGSGTWSSIICGIDWVTAHAQTLNIKVANMSLGGSGSSDNNCGLTNNDALHQAICRSTAQGVTYVVAAGNEGSPVSQSVPSSYDDTVITVSALADSDGATGGLGTVTGYGADDTFATFSNYGAGVDIGAPGVNIFSTWKGGSYATISGTSMASPHVAGASALYIATHPQALWAEVKTALQAIGESSGVSHTDPSGRHPEKVLSVSAF
ncbi:MAG: hypothetical protein RLZZ308_303 [Candidatus Parcubacteria bacterium]|jgi:subtilisin